MNNKEKFTSKVENYLKYRPTYPQEFIDYLVSEVGLSRSSVVTDIGAGTGILTKQLADKVRTIYAVEPNFNMRSACERYCDNAENFIAIDGSAEDTTLPNNSVDFITVAQAFHWFDREKTKIEFRRILKPYGQAILVWNSNVQESELVKEHDELCRKICSEFNGFSSGSDIGSEEDNDFFKNGQCDCRVFENNSLLSLESYIGSSLSTSYAPSERDENYKPFIDGLTNLFNKYGHNGDMVLPIRTYSYIGEV